MKKLPLFWHPLILLGGGAAGGLPAAGVVALLGGDPMFGLLAGAALFSAGYAGICLLTRLCEDDDSHHASWVGIHEEPVEVKRHTAAPEIA